MSLSRSSSNASILSDEDFLGSLQAMMEGPTSTDTLISQALVDIMRVSSSGQEENGSEDDTKVPGTQISMQDLLSAMIEGSVHSGGQRYVAAAIIAAYNSADEAEGAPSKLVGLASDWLRFLLLPVKRAYAHKEPPVSEHSTPTIEQSERHAEHIPHNRPADFRPMLMARDQSRCVVTGAWEVHVPMNGPHTFLEAAHIIRRAIFVDRQTSEDFLPATLDILKNFASLSDIETEVLTSIIDTPQNGMMLDVRWHLYFDHLEWCLLPTETVHKYSVHFFKAERAPSDYLPPMTVVFADHSKEEIPLPNAKLIAIHAAVAHVLHMSGAGKELDKILDFFGDCGAAGVVKDIHSDDLPIRLSLMSLTNTPHQLDFTKVSTYT